MIPGFPTTLAPGGNSLYFKTIQADDLGDGERLRFRVHTGYDQYVRALVDGEFQGNAQFATSADLNEILVPFANDEDDDHLLSLVPLGQWNRNDIEPAFQQEYFQTGREDRIFIETTTAPTLISYGDNGQLSTWSLSGLKRFSTLAPVPGRPTWGLLDLTISTAGGIHTVALMLNGVTLCSGSRSGNGSVTLSAATINGVPSGVSGTVTLTYTADVSGAAFLVARFPSELKLHYKTSAFTAPDFPRTAEKTLLDDGFSNTFRHRTPALAGGTWRIVAHQKDENGNEGTGLQSGGASVTIVTPPLPVTNLAYVSGGAQVPATDISWSASGTSGATYNIYDSLDTGILDTDTVAATHIAGTGTITHTLADINAAFTGKRYIVVRAVESGIEEASLVILEIEYASGARVAPHPPVPFMGKDFTTSGRTLNVPVVINTIEQDVAAAQIVLTITPADGGADQSVTVAVTAGEVGKIIKQNVSITASGDGLFIYKAQTKSAAGILSGNSDTHGPVELTTAVPGDPSTISVRAGF